MPTAGFDGVLRMAEELRHAEADGLAWLLPERAERALATLSLAQKIIESEPDWVIREAADCMVKALPSDDNKALAVIRRLRTLQRS